MKLKTINSSKLEQWHRHFLWIPKRVRINNNIETIGNFTINQWEYEYSILWLEFVQRKLQWSISIDIDDWRFIYWKQLTK